MNTPFRPASLFGLAVAAVLCGACAKPLPVLHVYTWADYVKPELVQRFESEQRCRVVIDTFDSNEAMFAKMKAGATGYDLVTPSSYMVSVLHSQGLLQPLDASLIPNRKNVDPEYLKVALDPTMHYSVPYMLTNSGFAYLASRVKDAVPSWRMFDRADLKGRMTMLNDMRETIGAALKSLGYSLNTTDEKQLEEARDVVVRWKKNLAKFENEQDQTGLASGEFLLVHGYSGDILKVQNENADVIFLDPSGRDEHGGRRPGDSEDSQGSAPRPRLHQLPPRPRCCRREHELHLLPLPQCFGVPEAELQDSRQPRHLHGLGDRATERGHPRPRRRQREVREGVGRDQGGEVSRPAASRRGKAGW